MADAVAVPWRFYIGKLHVFLARLEDHDDRAMSVPSVSVILGMSQRSAILVNVCDCFDHQIWAQQSVCVCLAEELRSDQRSLAASLSAAMQSLQAPWLGRMAFIL